MRAVGSRFERNGMQGIVCVGEDSVVELHDSVEITRNRGAMLLLYR